MVLYFSFTQRQYGQTVSSDLLSTQNNQSKLPEYIMSEQEEAGIKQFAISFLKLYNTYSFDDYSNLLALGDYQTPEMQKKTLEIVEKLKQNTSLGFKKELVLDQEYFVYEYPEGSKLFVELKGIERQFSNFYKKPDLNFNKSYIPKLENTNKLKYKLELTKYGKNWLVNNIETVKN